MLSTKRNAILRVQTKFDGLLLILLPLSFLQLFELEKLSRYVLHMFISDIDVKIVGVENDLLINF